MKINVKCRIVQSGAWIIIPTIIYFERGDDAPQEFMGGIQIQWLNLALSIALVDKH